MSESSPPVRPFIIKPTLRCFHQVGIRQPLTCGKPATWQGPLLPRGLRAYVCDDHRTALDAPIGGVLIFRRIGLVFDVLFAGTHVVQQTAEVEALARMEAAVEAIGGYINLQSVRSEIGTWEALPQPRSDVAPAGVPTARGSSPWPHERAPDVFPPR